MSKPTSEWTVLSMLKWATDYFDDKGIKNSRFSIEWLLSHVLSIKRLDLYLIFDRPLTNEDLATLKPFIKRRAAHEPLQYITGETDFLNTKIKVKPGVLIPRMETEQLVEMLLLEHDNSEAKTVLDIGTGSGCIPIAIKKEKPDWKVKATDISDAALDIAKSNASYNEVEIDFFRDDVFSNKAFSKEVEFDLIISNPPYILEEEREALDDEVKNYEPAQALFCKSTDLMYRAIHDFSCQKLKNEGKLYLELHENNGDEVNAIFNKEKWSTRIRKDYDGKNRFLVAKKMK
ncbi:MAG: peptide chain release factor N(5)-glutamine methyltransferase [Balneolaceae bacterium]|nr:peptide chain release factor N(5)-glutamine methyltransferase [Balneolaceae bacterium]MBO6545911.1 peptide chain release factor N(5)-glutamine methyltransferase [Balneolaceae bacterium]MBO6647307.1 peptide chain release factor N(5)-glutamine methyltransferase [Balneolaceae bacterium]